MKLTISCSNIGLGNLVDWTEGSDTVAATAVPEKCSMGIAVLEADAVAEPTWMSATLELNWTANLGRCSPKSQWIASSRKDGEVTLLPLHHYLSSDQ